MTQGGLGAGINDETCLNRSKCLISLASQALRSLLVYHRIISIAISIGLEALRFLSGQGIDDPMPQLASTLSGVRQDF